MVWWKMCAVIISGFVLVLFVQTTGIWNVPLLFLIPWFVYHIFKKLFNRKEV